MTLKQMKYALVTAKCASLSEASKKLFVSQPSMSEAIIKLEKELGFEIFVRERTGVTVTVKGEDFLAAVQSIMDQVANLEKQYENPEKKILKDSISVIHYFFMGRVFADIVNELSEKQIQAYDIKFFESGTLEVIEDVANGISGVGIISYTEHNKMYVIKELKKHNLECYELMSTRLFAFIRAGHKLSERKVLTMKDLQPYPYVSIWQNKSSMFYFTEEGIFLPANQKKIYIKDCATLRNLLKDTDAFTMGSGIIPSDVGSDETCAVEVTDAPITSICWIKRSGQDISELSKNFLMRCSEKLGRKLQI